MGNDISKDNTSDKKLEDEFRIKSNYIIQQLDGFFGPIEGGETTRGNKVKDLEFFIESDGKGEAPKLTKDIKRSIKEERSVCSKLVGTYRKSLKGLLADKDFKLKLNDFVQSKNLNKQNFEFNIRVASFLEKEKEGKEKGVTICDLVLDYYWLKYVIYRLLRNIDPYEEEYELINKGMSKLDGLPPGEIPKKQKIQKELYESRNKVRELINKNINQLLSDELTIDEMNAMYKKLVDDSSLLNYAKQINNSCSNIERFKNTKDPREFKIEPDVRTRNLDKKNFNLENYKKSKDDLCTGLKKKRVEKRISEKERSSERTRRKAKRKELETRQESLEKRLTKVSEEREKAKAKAEAKAEAKAKAEAERLKSKERRVTKEEGGFVEKLKRLFPTSQEVVALGESQSITRP